MSIRTKALIETAKTLGIGVATAVGYYFFVTLVGVKIALALLLAAIVGWVVYVIYDTNVTKLEYQEKRKQFE